ncbi:MAG TPA: linear amide C-N hydrolase, partial [Candidatus Binataceae bacterium]|nr:linear amide C-N hydrolase [Candidatus Binataceae bacterium]
MRLKYVVAAGLLTGSLIAFTFTGAAVGCSRIFWNDNGITMISGRTMDWKHHFNDVLWIMPRGIQ